MKAYAFVASAMMFVSATSFASVVPAFSTITTGTQAPGVWYVDRYAPATFANVGPQFGRSDVLGIGISSADSQANRPSGFGGAGNAFYNTQGRKYDVAATGIVRATADLYVPAEWRSAQDNGFRRTDMWGTLTTGNVLAPVDATFVYPIIGFTNFDGAARFRGWDANGGGWQNFALPVQFDAWNTLEFEFDPTVLTLKYFVNGALAYTDNNLNQTNTSFGPVTQIDNVMMQAFNFHSAYDPGNAFGNVNAGFANPTGAYNYSALWSNTPTSAVSAPGSLVLAIAALGIALAIRGRRDISRA